MFGKLKNLFIVSDEKIKKEAEEKLNDKTSAKQESISSPQPVSSGLSKSNLSKDEADPKFLEILFAAIEKNDIEGFDYLEFRTSLQNLKDLSMDEATKYNSAIAMAKTMGATAETINTSANHYLNILKSEEEKFQNALKSKQQKLEQEKTAGINKLKDVIASKERKIEELKAEIEADKKKLALKDAEIKASSEKIHQTNIHFHHAYSIIVDQIVNDVNNINKYAK
jgi:hypothetical protein